MARSFVRVARLLAVAALLCGAPMVARSDFAFQSTSTLRRFHVGDANQNISLFFSCHGVDITTVNAAGGVRFVIPAGLNCEWANISPIGVSDPAPPNTSGAISANVGYSGLFKNLNVTATANFTAGDNFDLTGLQFTNFSAPSPLTQLVNHTGSLAVVDHTDDVGNAFRIADFPANASSTAQTLSTGATGVVCNRVTVTESASAGNGGIWQNNGVNFGLRITIPLANRVGWNNGATVTVDPTCSAVTNGHMIANPVVTYEDFDGTIPGFKTVRIPVVSDFGTSNQARIDGLEFNVASDATDASFNLGVRTGPQANTTIHRTVTGLKTIEGEPRISTQQASPIVFTAGAAPTTVPQIRITESGGSPGKINTTNGTLRIVIPVGLDLIWDNTAVPLLTYGGGGSGTIGAPNYLTGKVLEFTINSNFTANRFVNVDNLRFRDIGLNAKLINPFNESGNLTLSVDAGHADPDATDDKLIRISRPTMSSFDDQVFLVTPPGPGTVAIQRITITDDPNVARFQSGVPFFIKIPAGFNMNWDTADLAANIVSGSLNAAVSYVGSKTLQVTPSANFAPGGTASFDGLSFIISPGTTSLPDKLELWMSNAGTAQSTAEDDKIIAIGGIPTMSSGGNQQFTLNDPIRAANNILITDAASSSLQAGNTIEVIIPGGLNMTFDTGGTAPVATPGPGTIVPPPAAGTVGAPVFFNNRTLRIPITTTFHPSQTLTISNLRFTNFLGASGPLALQLRVNIGGPVAATDSFTKAVGAPSIDSGQPQVFGVNDGSTLARDITVTEDGVTPRLLSGTNIRIRIPQLPTVFNMQFDPASVITATPSSAPLPATGTVGTPVIQPGNIVLQIPITGTFTPGQSILISGIRFRNFTGVSATDNLELEVNLSGVANNFDLQTIKIGTRPTITQVRTGDSNNNGSLDQLTVTFSENLTSTTSVTGGVGFTLAGYTIALGVLGGNVVTFTLNETGVADTGALPALTYNPAVGNLADLNDLLELNPVASPIPATTDGAAPVLVGFTSNDGDGNGFLDSITFTFSENLDATQEDINDWRITDADGVTNLLVGLTTANLNITNNQLVLTLGNSSGTDGIPRFRYLSDGLGGRLRDLAVPTANFVPLQTNNTKPIANAGPNQTVAPMRVTLNATNSFDPDGQPVTFFWSAISFPTGVPPTLSSTTSGTPDFLVTMAGNYVFQVSVFDGLDTSISQTTVTVVNVPPTAVALFDQVSAAGVNVLLDGRFCRDVNGDALTFTWSQIPNPPTPGVAINNSATSLANFTPAVTGIYRFRLAVSDGSNTSLEFITVIVNGANGIPRSNAGPDQMRPIGSVVKLDGGLSADPDGNPLTYAWAPAGILSNPASQTPTFLPTQAGIYTFNLVVTDSLGESSLPTSCNILVFDPANVPPTAVANKLSPPGNPVVGDLVTLDATGSVDPEGATMQFSWSQVTGPAAVLINPGTAQPTFTPVLPGDYVFRLVVSDGVQQSFAVRVSVQVIPVTGWTMPTVTAGIDPGSDPDNDGRVNTSPVLMFASGTVDLSTPPFVGYWTQVGGTPVALSSPFSGAPTFAPGVAGVYRFNVIVVEWTGLTAQQRVEVVFDNATNTVPTANAGADQAVNAGDTVTLDASASTDSALDLDAVIDFSSGLRPYWQQVSGPVVPISDPFAVQPTFRPTLAGGYLFALVVSDGKAASATDFVSITVTGTVSGGTVVKSSSGGCGMGAEALVLIGLLALARRLRR